MLNTAQDTYNAFLDGIKKSYTGTVVPKVFIRIINDWGLDEWLKQKVSEEAGVEVTQKLIDDLQLLKVITDGSMAYNGDVMYDIIPDIAGSYYFSKPDGISPLHNVSGNDQVYPKYLRLLSVKFKLNYVNNVCGLTGISDYLKAQKMRSSERSVIEDNYYLQPTDDNLYFEWLNDKVKLTTGTISTARSMRFEYLRFPKTFYFDPNRNIKSCLTINANSSAAGTIQLTFTTASVTYVSPVINIVSGQSKYTVALNIYNAIFNDSSCPSSIKGYINLTLNSFCIGQYGFDGVLTLTTTGTVPANTITTGLTVSDVNIELPDQQRKEVVEQAVRIYLERVTDERWKSYLSEEAIREQAKK